MFAPFYCPSSRFLKEHFDVTTGTTTDRPNFDNFKLPNSLYHQPSQESNGTECGVFVCALGWFFNYDMVGFFIVFIQSLQQQLTPHNNTTTHSCCL